MNDEHDDRKEIRWGIVGCGAVTERKSGPAYQKADGFKLAAVMRRDYTKAQDYATRHGVEFWSSDAEDIINSDDIDAVYVATPPDSHKYYALKVAEAGKPCCIEKPLAPSYRDCLTICRAFDDKKIPLFVAYYRRSLPRFNAVREALETNRIGETRHITWNLSKPPSEADLAGTSNWRTDKSIAVGGYFDDLASHGLDLFAYLLGDFDQVFGVGLNQQHLYSSMDAVTACWSHTNGITGTGSWNFGCNVREDDVVIYGSAGSIKFSVFDEKPIVISSANGEQKMFVDNPGNIQLHHVQNIARSLIGGAPHPSNGASASHTAWVMDKILGGID